MASVSCFVVFVILAVWICADVIHKSSSSILVYAIYHIAVGIANRIVSDTVNCTSVSIADVLATDVIDSVAISVANAPVSYVIDNIAVCVINAIVSNCVSDIAKVSRIFM